MSFSMWELIKRLLASATDRQSFLPAIVVSAYYREGKSAKLSMELTREEAAELANSISIELEDNGLIENVVNTDPRKAMLGCKRRTAFGDEVYQALQGQNVTDFFEGMHCDINAGEIRRILHQLNS
ncbi:hypothetical protein QQL38_07285 [Pseudomonas syringae]|uniref:hypothetical protein n=1 Tax=Pseudomonas syringae group TaxID=136849 RepID=UPI0008ED4A9B|nr:hypothetical protein [Pseudomonas syringae]MBD8567882.1 hypothetical protein [Pseudomonas syringae]MCL6306311.1 hypothetical protein [Pseudomonas syringae]MEE4084822.1 hypothetical protein [Pseudomonas viridiflava]SFH49206.1 hypothetical protein SAMN05444507_101250 [Pseudomonas syringae]